MKFRVTNFRSVEDSDWIEADEVTALIGTNEAGKTNLLVPLWKLHPAKDGELNAIADYPRTRFNEIRVMENKPVFIQAEFRLSEDLAKEVGALTDYAADQVRITHVSRRLDGRHLVSFPDAAPPESVSNELVTSALESCKSELEGLSELKAEDGYRESMLPVIEEARELVGAWEEAGATRANLSSISELLDRPRFTKVPKTGLIVPRFRRLKDEIRDLLAEVTKPRAGANDEARELVMSNLPTFVYYSNYGNLDSEIYLPHVIENLKREDLGPAEAAKTRTLKVLFDFVRLEPQEILELGQDFPAQQGRPSAEQIEEINERKKERSILLQSAGTELTSKFRDWWRQGDYRFRFEADGNHFRIWVSDDLRPEEIELEGRSSGLQWFLSFYLIFLVESEDSHAGSILLLDEPGLTLHPLAQEDLFAFFENLAEVNQILYTTHSPFMVDSDHLDRVKAVFVNEKGATCASADLRAGDSDSSQAKSIFPVHAALGLTASRTLLQFADSTIVEGHSDQLYLSAMKTHLIALGLLKPARELAFLPAWGTKGIKAVLPLVAGVDERLPPVLVDSDAAGRAMSAALRGGLYNASPERVIEVGEFVQLEDAETEYLWPFRFLVDVISRYLRGPETEDFDAFAESGLPIAPQAEAYAEKHGIELRTPGWKVEVAERAKAKLLRQPGLVAADSAECAGWVALFERLTADRG